MRRTNHAAVLPLLPVLLLVLGGLFAYSARAGETWKFIVVGDSRGKDNGVNTEVLRPLAARIAQSGADFLLFNGDLTTGSLRRATTKRYLEQWRATMAPVYEAGIKVYPIAGNHEWIDFNLPETWRQVFPELPGNGPKGEEKMTYSFTHKNALVIALDVYFGHRHRVDQKWLDKQLAARDAKAQPHVFVSAHEPAYSAHHKVCLDDEPEARDAFIQSLVNAGCRTYFCGHDHFYANAAVTGFLAKNRPIVFHQVIAGTGGAPVYDWNGRYDGNNGEGRTVADIYHDEHWGGYCQVEVDGLRVTVKYMKRLDAGGYATAETFSYEADD
jgi:hypothetical protein